MRKACSAIDGSDVAVVRRFDSLTGVVLGILRPLIVIPTDLVAKLRIDEFELVLVPSWPTCAAATT